MADPVSLGKAQAVGLLAFVRGTEVGGVNNEEFSQLVGEYSERRNTLQAPLDVADFTQTLLGQLQGPARDALYGYLQQDAGAQPVGQTGSLVSAARVRAAAVLGFARGVEASYLNRYGEVETDFWNHAKAIDSEETGALKSEFYERRGELSFSEQQEFRAILNEGNGLSDEAAKAIRSFW